MSTESWLNILTVSVHTENDGWSAKKRLDEHDSPPESLEDVAKRKGKDWVVRELLKLAGNFGWKPKDG